MTALTQADNIAGDYHMLQQPSGGRTDGLLLFGGFCLGQCYHYDSCLNLNDIQSTSTTFIKLDSIGQQSARQTRLKMGRTYTVKIYQQIDPVLVD
jgi:hypothetical protein